MGIDVARAPRAVMLAGAPYRDTGDLGPGPLAARELRHVCLAAPAAPRSYRGRRFAITWSIDLLIDGVVVAHRPLVIGPDRAGLAWTAPAAAAEPPALPAPAPALALPPIWRPTGYGRPRRDYTRYRPTK